MSTKLVFTQITKGVLAGYFASKLRSGSYLLFTGSQLNQKSPVAFGLGSVIDGQMVIHKFLGRKQAEAKAAIWAKVAA